MLATGVTPKRARGKGTGKTYGASCACPAQLHDKWGIAPHFIAVGYCRKLHARIGQRRLADLISTLRSVVVAHFRNRRDKDMFNAQYDRVRRKRGRASCGSCESGRLRAIGKKVRTRRQQLRGFATRGKPKGVAKLRNRKTE